MWTVAALFLLLCSAGAAAPADAPLDKGNPLASNIQPYAEPPSHTAHVDSAGALWGEVGDAIAAAGGGNLGGQIEDGGPTLDSLQGDPDAAPAGDDLTAGQAVGQVGSDDLSDKEKDAALSGNLFGGFKSPGAYKDIAAMVATEMELAGSDLEQTAQANSAPLDLQDAIVATTDASAKTLQGKGINNPATLAVQDGKPVSAAAQAPLTAFQNILVLAPQQAAAAKAPSALPSALQAGAATPVQPSASGGRKMLQSYPDCCNSYTVKPGDTLASIAAAYGQPTNGVTYLQAINGLHSTAVTPGQSIMLPCSRVLSYMTAYNAGLLTKTASG